MSLMASQRTVRRSVTCAGIGLHSGHKVTLSLKPAPVDTRIRFQRTDLAGLEIPAHVSHLSGRQQLQTGLTARNASVDTVEHLLAALRARRADNGYGALNHPGGPLMAGRADPWAN